jgi:uncharacterized protein (TIGR03435 family)
MKEYLLRAIGFGCRRLKGIGSANLSVLMLCGFATLPVAAQDIAGTWQGTLEAGKDQRIVVKIAKVGSGWAGVVFNLDSNMAYEGRNTTQMSLNRGFVRFAIALLDVSYEGKLSADGVSIAGAWKQGSGDAHTLTLARVVGDAAWEIPKADALMANDADPDWEVATVKPSESTGANSGFQLNGPRIHVLRKTVEEMLLMSYGLHKKQIAGAPDWIATELWDVEGVADAPGKPALKQLQSLVRKILAERFGFKAHTETREMSVYAITVAKDGPKLTRSASDPNELISENESDNGGQTTMRMTNSTISEFAGVMNFYMERPVVDQTGLTGRYDFQLKWTFDESRVPSDGTAAPSLFTAMQEQMGLKLEPAKGPAEVLVIDHVDRPTAN